MLFIEDSLKVRFGFGSLSGSGNTDCGNLSGDEDDGNFSGNADDGNLSGGADGGSILLSFLFVSPNKRHN